MHNKLFFGVKDEMNWKFAKITSIDLCKKRSRTLNWWYYSTRHLCKLGL